MIDKPRNEIPEIDRRQGLVDLQDRVNTTAKGWECFGRKQPPMQTQKVVVVHIDNNTRHATLRTDKSLSAALWNRVGIGEAVNMAVQSNAIGDPGIELAVDRATKEIAGQIADYRFGCVAGEKGMCEMVHGIFPIGFTSIINPATKYIVFRVTDKRQIKAQLAGNGCSIGKSCNAALALISRP